MYSPFKIAMSKSSSPKIKDNPRIPWAKENDTGLVAWLSKGTAYTIIGAIIAFIATLSATVIPIHFSGDWSRRGGYV